jgi:hypothetical protein
MKNVKLIDALPSLFGVIAMVGALSQGLWSETNLGPIMLFGGGAIALITGLVSIINASVRHTFSKIHVLNILWVLLMGLCLYFIYFYLNHPLRFTF